MHFIIWRKRSQVNKLRETNFSDLPEFFSSNCTGKYQVLEWMIFIKFRIVFAVPEQYSRLNFENWPAAGARSQPSHLGRKQNKKVKKSKKFKNLTLRVIWDFELWIQEKNAEYALVLCLNVCLFAW